MVPRDREPPTHQLLPSLVLLQVRWREAGFPRGDPEVPALTSWILRGSSQAQLEHLNGLTLWPWRWEDPLQQRGPLAGHLLPLPVSSCSDEAVIPSSRCWALSPRSALQLAPHPPACPPACCYHQTIRHSSWWPRDSRGGRKRKETLWEEEGGASGSLSSPSVLSLLPLSPPFALCLYFWQYDAICPR